MKNIKYNQQKEVNIISLFLAIMLLFIKNKLKFIGLYIIYIFLSTGNKIKTIYKRNREKNTEI